MTSSAASATEVPPNPVPPAPASAVPPMAPVDAAVASAAQPVLNPSAASAPVAPPPLKPTRVTAVKNPKNYDPDELMQFYRGEIPNSDKPSEKLSDIWDLSYDEKESRHNFIQWLWPAFKPSRFNPKGPVIDVAFAKRLRADAKVVENARISFEAMLDFYGLEYLEKEKAVQKAANFDERKGWLRPGDHNHDRISRMLESLGHFGLKEEQMAFFKCLKELKLEDPSTISDSSMKYWCEKVGEKWAKVSSSINTKLDEKRVEKTLERLVKADKTTWIRSDLTLRQSGLIGRIIWFIAKHFNCLRSWLFGIDLKESQERLVEIGLKIIYDRKGTSYGKFKDLYEQAVKNYESVVSEQYHVTYKKQIGDIQFELTPGDITKETTEAIVNAANSKLKAGGGVDAAIHDAAGPGLQTACDVIIAKVKKRDSKAEPCPTGHAVVTPSFGKINANGVKFIIHTVGPIWSKSRNPKANVGKEQQLYNAYVSSLEKANKKGAASVAFPSISTGIFDFPIEKAGKIVVKAITDFTAKHGSACTVKKVRLLAYGMNIKDGVDNFAVYRDAFSDV